MADLMETDEELSEFTLAEVMEMTTLINKNKELSPTQEFCKELATKFSWSPHRTRKSSVKWEQVQDWFLDQQKSKEDEVTFEPAYKEESVVPRLRARPAKYKEESVVPRLRAPPAKYKEESVVPQPRARPAKKAKSKKELLALVLSKKYNSSGYTRLPYCAHERPQKPRVPAVVMAKELSELTFEALSAKDLGWYDVASFLNYRVLYTGELEVRVRFAGFGNEEDEWVNIKTRVRERSIPLEPSECDKVNVGDHIMCFRDDEYLAVYADADIVDIQKQLHDDTKCTCVFVVRYELDNFEEKTTLDQLCCRPTRNNNNISSVIQQLETAEGDMSLDLTPTMSIDQPATEKTTPDKLCCWPTCNNDNIHSVIPQVESADGDMCADLTPTMSAEEKTTLDELCGGSTCNTNNILSVIPQVESAEGDMSSDQHAEEKTTLGKLCRSPTCNSISSVITQVESEEGDMYADLTPTMSIDQPASDHE